MLNRALLSLFFESELERKFVGDVEMKSEFKKCKKRLKKKTFALNLGIMNFYFAVNKVSRKIVLAGNLVGSIFVYVNYRNHLFDDAIELMVRH